MLNQIFTLPDLKTLDFTNAYAMQGISHLLLSLMQRSGAFTTQTARSPETQKLISIGKRWIKGLEQNIALIPPHDVLRAISCYDMVYRICWQGPNDSFYNKQFSRAFEAYIHGDKQVSETELMRVISSGLRRRDKFYFDRPLSWNCMTIDSWIKQFFQDKFKALPIAEKCARLSIIISDDLFAYFGSKQDEPKITMAKEGLKEAISYDGNDAETLMEIIFLIRNSRRLVKRTERIRKLELKAMNALTQCPELHETDRKAFALDLDFYQQEGLI